MGDIKPLGSEKLAAQEKLKRILELTYYNEKTNKTTSKAELVKESNSGGIFGIVKEKDGYYVKRGLNEESLDYIGGLFMKNKNKFSSYAEALKRLELLKGQEELQEATKYVLKQKTKEAPADMPPMPDTPPAPDMSMGDTPPSPEDAPSSDSGDVPPPPSDEMPEPSDSDSEQKSDAKRSDYMAEVQKYAGKLGQELRDQKEKMESDDIKYVLNMVISAVDLEKLDFDDLEEVSKKFERDEEGSEEEKSEPEGESSDSEEGSSEEETPPPPAEDENPDTELSEYDDISSKLDEFINTPINDEYGDIHDEEIDFTKLTDVNPDADKEDPNLIDGDEGDVDEIVELDLDEIKNQINKSVGETLSKYFVGK